MGASSGVFAVGGFLEGGAQKLPGGEAGSLIAIGVSVRLPAIAVLYCCVVPK